MKEALLYEKLDDQRVRCNLCAHRCVIAEGRKGVCLVRENREGILYTLVYGIPLSQAVDPIEKKPLFHFYPGSTAFSIATAGCNFRCAFCQNADISQMPRDRGQILGRQATPEEVVRSAKRSDCRSIASTYTEPDQETAERLLKLIDILEDLDDVQEVHTNADISEEILATLDAQ